MLSTYNGGLRDLGAVQDARDAEVVFEELRRAKTSPDPRAAAKKAFLYKWQHRRHQYLEGSRHLATTLYSPAALELLYAAPAGTTAKGLRFEHVIPKEKIVDLLLDADSSARVLEVLRRYLILAYLTVAEDKRLNAAGHRHTHPDIDDPWLRYRLAGLDPDTFSLPLRAI